MEDTTDAMALSAERQELLARRLTGRAGAATAGGPTETRPAQAPLSSGQRRLWFLDQLSPGDVAYNIAAAYRIRGALDHSALQRAIGWGVDRHEVLRTHYDTVDGEPVPVVEAPGGFRLRQVDLRPAPDPLAQARELVRGHADEPFDLTRGPLFRARLITLGTVDHVLSVVVHHSVFDRESLELWAAETGQAYQAYHAGRVPEADPLPAQYADFATWQRSTLAATLDRHLPYWLAHLADAPTVLELPAQHRRPITPSHRAGQVEVLVPPPTAGALREFAQRQGVTLFMVYLAVYQALLSRYSGSTDVVVGCPLNERRQVAWEGLVGFFANSIPIRAVLTGDPRAGDLVEQVKTELLEAYAHASVPFDHLVERLAPARDLSRNPFLQHWFDLVATGGYGRTDALSLAGLDVSEFDGGRIRTRFDTEMHLVGPSTGGVSGRLLYATDLFTADTMAGFVRHYTNLLAAVAADPWQRLSALQMFDHDELQRILVDWGTAT